MLCVIVVILKCKGSNAECIKIYRYVALALNSKVMLKMYTACVAANA